MGTREDRRLGARQLRWQCDPSVFGVDSSRDLTDSATIIGQERALRALKLGVELRSPGYNLFVSGLSGTGRMTAVRQLLVGLSDRCVDVPDKAYVHNHDDPSRPLLLLMARGRVRKFRERMHELGNILPRRLHELFEDETYLGERRKREELASEKQRGKFEEITEAARLAGLALVQVKTGAVLRPGIAIPVGEEVFPLEALNSLVKQGKIEEEKAELLREKAAALVEKLERALLESRRAQRSLDRALEEFDRGHALRTFEADLADIAAEFPEPGVTVYLERLQNSILRRLDLFRDAGDDESERRPALRAFLRTLEVNAILDNADREDTPVLVESNPTYANLFGTVEHKVSRSGEVSTDHTRIRPGSIIQADGGYLILSVEDLMQEAGVWHTLKRVLKNGKLEIQPLASAFGLAPLHFKPEPVPLSLKVILIGDTHLYSLLHAYDHDFRKTFKVRVDFDSVMERTPENIRRYGMFLKRLSAEEGLLPFDAAAMSAVAEEGARRTEQDNRLSTRFSEIADLARESSHFAQVEGSAHVSVAHVQRALREALDRDNLYDRKMAERILDGTILIDTDSESVGQVNGLTVFQSGRFSFGKPTRITATVSAGDHGILNIEREVALSGEIHDKGVLILASFLRERFGQRHPISLSASLCFEQNYGGVEGDSASSTELYALMSSLASAPIQQGIGVTGSVNQKGFIQPIGGINDKVEGFFEICARRGLNGAQGVLLPVQNVGDLMLEKDVIEAVEAGKFHLWAVSHVDQGIEILTGIPAGTPGRDGAYPSNTINGRIAERLLYLAEIARDFKAPGGDDKGSESSGPGDDSYAGAPPAGEA